MSQLAEHPVSHGGRSRLSSALVGVLAAGALAGVPVAQADGLGSVRGHVRAADAALHRVVAAADSGTVTAPLAQLQAQLRAAGRDSGRLYRRAHSSRARGRAATALTKLAAQQTRDAAMLTPLVGQLDGSGQIDLAGFLASVIQGREQVLTLVSQLIGQLPTALQADIASIVAQLSNAGTGQVGQLAGTISAGSIACPQIDAIGQVVATVITSVPADLARVQSMLSFLPADAQAELTAIVTGLPEQLNALLASLKQDFSCSSVTPVGGVPSAPAAGLGSVTQLVQSLLSSFLPAISAGQSPSPVTIPGPVSGVLAQVTSLLPGLGTLFSGDSSGGLLGLIG